jgi:hypothetical protein
MKSLRFTLSLCLLLAATAALSQTAAQKSFDQIKSLSGSWEGKDSHGKSLQVSFRDTAGGSAVMSEILGEGHEDMISMFNLDGPNRLLITHYCGAGNQSRMQASTSADGKTVTFNFVDATNLATPDAGHMQSVVFTMVDANHHTEDWTFLDHGNEIKELFGLQKKDLQKKM